MVGIESSATGTTGLGGIQSSIQGGMQPNVIDYNHPLFLNPSYVSGAHIISFQLTGIENYSVWNRSMRVALLGRNKMGLIDGTCAKDKFPSEFGNNWEMVNAVVLSWIMNSVAKELLGGIMYASIAKEVWDDLYERFHKIDAVRTFNLHKNISSMSQENMSMCAYFSKLKDLWDEFEALVPAPNCECDKSKDFVVHLQKLNLFKFLMGLNESYLQARSQILLMSPLPSVNQAYAMIVSDESHKAVATSAGVLGVRPGAQLRDYEIAMLILDQRVLESEEEKKKRRRRGRREERGDQQVSVKDHRGFSLGVIPFKGSARRACQRAPKGVLKFPHWGGAPLSTPAGPL
ncbi:hypothetical protein KY285_019333 [Solanum tuberosum]|nr:hypothetical protein KY285_019333 [Solanum tuberosum]